MTAGSGGRVKTSVGVGHQPLVELVVAGHEHGHGLLALAPGPPRLLPQGGDGAREAVEDAGVEAADVDAELEGGGGHDGPEAPGEQVGLDLATLGGQVAAAVGGHAVPQLPGEPALDLGGHHLGPSSAATEGDGAMAVEDHAGHQVGRLLVGRPLGTVGLPAVVVVRQVDVHLRLDGGVPQGDEALTLAGRRRR